jgi:hypothetical protein
MHLLLQPCGSPEARKHFAATIEPPVALSRLLPFLTADERHAVRATFGDEVAIWGVTSGEAGGNVKKWARLSIGDTALFCKDNAFFLKATVAFKVHNSALADELWGTQPNGATWEYIFFLTDLEPVDIRVTAFNRAASYAPAYVVRGFSVLDEALSARILEELDLTEGSGPAVAEPAMVAAAKAALARLSGNLNIPATAKRRAEQGLLRIILLANRNTECCAICGKTLPVDLLFIGHIRKRHSCSDEQKKDLNNVMPVCLLGCDRLFEEGYIHVDASGVVRAPLSPTLSPELLAHLKELDGKRCHAHNQASAAFFAWHRERQTVSC